MSDVLSQLPPQLQSVKHALLILPTAAVLGAALGMIRPIRKSLVPRSSHVMHELFNQDALDRSNTARIILDIGLHIVKLH